MEPMSRIPPIDRPATYEDLMNVPDTMVAEIVDDELHASPHPALRHANVTSSLGVMIGGPFHHGRGGPGGWWILDEPELHFGRNVLVPDLAGWRRTRLPRLPDAAYCSVFPDWVCEVLSPSTAALDRSKKLAIYAHAIRETQERIAPLFLALRDASSTEPEARAIWQEISDRRATNMRKLVRDLGGTGRVRKGLSIDEAADVVWVTNSPELYVMLTSERGWSPGRYERWLADAWCRLLLA